MTCPSVTMTLSLSEVTALCVCSSYATILIVLKGMVAPSFNIKTPALSLLTLIECTPKCEGPF